MGNEFRSYRAGGWPAVLSRYVEVCPDDGRAPTLKVYALILLGRRQEAIQRMEAMEKAGDSLMITLTDPLFDPLRDEPRFTAIMRRLGYRPVLWK